MKKVLIIGAGFLQNFVIKKAKEMGYYTLAVDADPEAVGFENADKYAVINIVNEEECLEFAKKEKIDGVLTAATDYGVLTASYIAEHMELPGLDYSVAKLIKNKYLVRKCLFEKNVDDTEQTYEVNADTDIFLIAGKLNYPVMVKPCDGSGSRGASRVDSQKELQEACEFAMAGSITRRAEIESFIDGEEYGVESLVINGQPHVLGVMKKWMTEPPYYAELGHAIPCGLPVELENRIVECVKKALKALGINHGSVNMDLLVTKEGKIHIIDVGARMGGNMIGPCIIPYGTGIDYMGNMLKAAVGDPIEWKKNEHISVATKLLAFKGGVVRDLSVLNRYTELENVEIYHHLKVDDSVNEYHTNLDGCGYIVVKNVDVNAAELQAKKILCEVEKEIFR